MLMERKRYAMAMANFMKLIIKKPTTYCETEYTVGGMLGGDYFQDKSRSATDTKKYPATIPEV